MRGPRSLHRTPQCLTMGIHGTFEPLLKMLLGMSENVYVTKSRIEAPVGSIVDSASTDGLYVVEYSRRDHTFRTRRRFGKIFDSLNSVSISSSGYDGSSIGMADQHRWSFLQCQKPLGNGYVIF